MWIGEFIGFECIEIIKKSWEKWLGTYGINFWGTLLLGWKWGFLKNWRVLNVDECLLELFVTGCCVGSYGFWTRYFGYRGF